MHFSAVYIYVVEKIYTVGISSVCAVYFTLYDESV
jgi:hypothetical protein